MKVLLTGATGLVGSHVLDGLCARGIGTAILLRKSSPTRFVAANLPRAEARLGALDDPASLAAALRDITHVVHCAGAVRALDAPGFFRVNQLGTRHLVEAINQTGGRVQRLVQISSLAASGPGTAEHPAREDAPPAPVSVYGRSKLAGEEEVRQGCRAEFVVLRPPGVYGPRDGEFLRLFQAVKAHVCPRFGGGRQPLSLVYVCDLADAILACLGAAGAAGQTFHVAGAEVITAGQLAELMAELMNRWTLPLPLPTVALWPVCLLQELCSRVTGRPSVLSRQKYAELSAPGWVCDASRLGAGLGITCGTPLRQGLAETLAWYQREHWL